MVLPPDEHDDPFALLGRHRASIVRLCAAIVGDRHAAEDIAQETLLVAWRRQHSMHTPDVAPHWLAGIARNLCRNWLRAHRHDRHLQSTDADEPTAHTIADNYDLEHELERHELADLLDRALALLPAKTRAVLVGHYVEDTSHAELASALGISDKAVSMRISRGKLLVKHLLQTELHAEAVAFGLVAATSETWQPTRIWCQRCAAHRLLMHAPAHPGTVSFRCPGCTPTPDTTLSNFRLANTTFNDMLGELQRPRSMLNRTRAWVSGYFRQALRDHAVPCTNCGRVARLVPFALDDTTPSRDQQIQVVCDWCGEVVSSSVLGLTMALPQAQAFWQEHERVRSTSFHEIEVAGRPAFHARFETVAGARRLDVVMARDDLRLLSIDGATAGEV